jgi:hypothetical protein
MLGQGSGGLSVMEVGIMVAPCPVEMAVALLSGLFRAERMDAWCLFASPAALMWKGGLLESPGWLWVGDLLGGPAHSMARAPESRHSRESSASVVGKASLFDDAAAGFSPTLTVNDQSSKGPVVPWSDLSSAVTRHNLGGHLALDIHEIPRWRS